MNKINLNTFYEYDYLEKVIFFRKKIFIQFQQKRSPTLDVPVLLFPTYLHIGCKLADVVGPLFGGGGGT